MPTQEDFLANPGSEVPRDHQKRPLIIPVGGGKPVPYTRCTTYVDCLDDKYNLHRWDERNLAAGLGARDDLYLRAASLGMPPLDPDKSKVWKNQMNDLVKQAKEAAASSASATIGTSLHAYSEKIDRGEDLGFVPERYRRHLESYERATALLEPVHIERFTVQDDLRIGGTPDRVTKIRGFDGLYIADVKTGTVEFGTLKMAMQLAVYSRSSLYDHHTGERTSLGDVNQDRGVIIALDAKTGECQLLWIDLAAGWEAVQVATVVRKWRSRNDLTKSVDLPALNGEAAVLDGLGAEVINTETGEVTPRLEPNTEAALVTAIQTARSDDDLVTLWRAAGPAWTPKHTELAGLRKAELLLSEAA